jgi:hypothetical protein
MDPRTPLFLVQPEAGLVRMSPSSPATEDELQDLIARYPELIGDSEGGLLLIERENAIPDKLNGAGRWSIDHLYVTKSATPVLVEVKRASDTRIRREVVGQMLDYAATGVAYWLAGSLGERFAIACGNRGSDATLELQAFLGEERDSQDFWRQVDANLRGGRVKLVFVADEIPSELARIVEFLNEQMTADVRAIELRYYEGPGGVKTLAPRIIGETERTRVEKGTSKPRFEPVEVDAWLEARLADLGEDVLKGARAMLAVMREFAPEVNVASTQGSIYARLRGPAGKYSYPMSILASGRGQISFGNDYGGMSGAGERLDEATRAEIYERFSEVVGPLSNRNLRGFPTFTLAALSEASVVAKFRAVAKDVFTICG